MLKISWDYLSGLIGSPEHRGDRARLRRREEAAQLCRTLLSEKGEASGTKAAVALAAHYQTLSEADREDFFAMLAAAFAPDEAALRTAAAAYLEEPGPQAAAKLAIVAEPPRQELIRRLNMAPGGTALIVEMRDQVLKAQRAHPELDPLAADLNHLLTSWFNRGFLQMRQLDWNTPAAILEKLIRYEAVHAIRDWDDLHRRLQGDRRCFGFFHPALPDQPLIFVEVALTNHISDAIGPLLTATPGDARALRPTTAIFYSINNCVPGLKGVNLGNFLIKQVVSDLMAEIRTLRVFSTLSPIPGFRPWLDAQLQRPGHGNERLRALLAAPDWWNDPAAAERLRPALLGLCARYLLGIGGEGESSNPMDSVARFHLSNGARLERINWLANTTPKGVAESWGLMVNYRYVLKDIEENHEDFVSHRRVVRSREIDTLVAGLSGAAMAEPG